MSITNCIEERENEEDCQKKTKHKLKIYICIFFDVILLPLNKKKKKKIEK